MTGVSESGSIGIGSVAIEQIAHAVVNDSDVHLHTVDRKCLISRADLHLERSSAGIAADVILIFGYKGRYAALTVAVG